MDLIELIDDLLKYADPEKSAHERLTMLRGKVARNVMLSPRNRRFLQHLVSLRDNVECKKLGHAGGCSVPRIGRCVHKNRFDACPYYEAQRGHSSPLSGL